MMEGMHWVRSGLFLLLAGVACVTFLWLSAKKKPSPTSRLQSKAVQERSADQSPPEMKQNHTRQPLEILYPGPTDNTNNDIEVDIIAVHGLGSSVDWSWTWKDGEKRINWLRDPDMLPAKVPKSRIMVHNYESRWHADAPKTRLQLCGEELIHSVHSFRGGTSKRPIVFVGHSLGGNVIVHALLHANGEGKYKYLPEMTVGVVFLGTPLRGTKWQPFLDSLAQLMGPAGSHRGITKELGFDGPELRDRLHRFCQLRNKLSMPVSCFSELHETDYGRRFGISGVAKGMIVEEASACIPGLDRHALQTDHLKINKYHGPTDRGFLSVSAVISEMCTNANDIVRRRQYPKDIIINRDYALKHNPNAERCLRDLFLTDPLEDKKALKRMKGDRARGTCEWIFGTEELTAWLGSSQTDRPEGQATQVLWLHGNPGTGKSTMAIFLTEELSTTFSATDRKTLAYFFCDSGFDKRKTATSVVRGLLLQLVQQHPQLLDYLLPKYNERGAELFKSFDALWTIFMDAATDQKTGRKYCIIDALDECDRESQETLLQQFQETFQSRNASPDVRILVTSRPYPEISQYLERFANKDLAAFVEVKQDIDRCIKEKVAALTDTKHYTDKVKSQVSDILREKADGTFLWVGLACKELENKPSHQAVPLLRNMPKGLHALYKKLLDTAFEQEAEAGGADVIRHILGIVAVGLRPLSVLELSEACQLHIDEEDIDTRHQFVREKIASCRLMIIIQNDKVLLLHQSVKDYLAGPSSDYFLNELQAHAHLAYRCVDFLMEQFQKQQKKGLLSDYATQNWPKHAHRAKESFEVRDSEADFFEINSPCREHWLERVRFGIPYDWNMIPQAFSIMHVAARWGIPALINHVMFSRRQGSAKDRRQMDVNYVDASERTPLQWAVQSGHGNVVSILLGRGANLTAALAKAAATNETSGKELIEVLIQQRGDEVPVTEEVVEAAAGNRQNGKEVMELLLERRGDEVSITERVVKAAAGNKGNGKKVMELLLERRGGDVSITDRVVEAAAGNWRNGKEVMELLLERRGDDVSITEEVVKAAAANTDNGKKVMELLFERRGDEFPITEQVASILARNFDKAIMRRLIERRGDVSITEEVVKAAAGNWRNGKGVMELLLERRGDEVSITEGVVKAAARNWWNGKEVMELLLERRGDEVSITEEVVKAAAANTDNGKKVVELLFERRGDEFPITEQVASILARNFDKAIMRRLIERRGDVSITEEVVKAAAGNTGNGKEVMELLLERRGDEVPVTEEVVEAAAGNRQNGKEVMELLLERRGDEVSITEEVVEIAAGNKGNGKKVMELLLERRGDEVSITEGVVEAAARNEGNGKEVMELLLERRGDEISITEGVVCMVANAFDKQVMELLLERRGDEVSITEEVVKAVAGNWRNGKEVMELLLGRRGDEVSITEGVVKSAAGNWRNGKEVMELLLERRGDKVSITEGVVCMVANAFDKQVMELLLERRGDDVSITEEVVKAAAGNWRNGEEVMELLLERQGDEVSITAIVCILGRSFSRATMRRLLERRAGGSSRKLAEWLGSDGTPSRAARRRSFYYRGGKLYDY